MDGLTRQGDGFYSYELKRPLPLEFPSSNSIFMPAPDPGWEEQKMKHAEAGAGGSPTPFAVAITTPHASTPGATISAYSYLHKDLTPASQTITSLTTEFTLTSTLKVWLNVSVNASLEVTAAAIATGTAFPSLIVTSGTPAAQTAFNVPIGKVISGSAPTAPGFDFTLSSTAYHFEQLLASHLLVQNLCYSGTPALYAFPWSGT